MLVKHYVGPVNNKMFVNKMFVNKTYYITEGRPQQQDNHKCLRDRTIMRSAIASAWQYIKSKSRLDPHEP